MAGRVVRPNPGRAADPDHGRGHQRRRMRPSPVTPEVALANQRYQRRARHRFRRLSGGWRLASTGDWTSSNPAFTIFRGSRGTPYPYAWARPPLSWHALVPFTFRIQVSHQTQEPPSEFLPAAPWIQQGASRRSAHAADRAAPTRTVGRPLDDDLDIGESRLCEHVPDFVIGLVDTVTRSRELLLGHPGHVRTQLVAKRERSRGRQRRA